jgi:hypothetical protein
MSSRGHGPDTAAEVLANTSALVGYTLRLQLTQAGWERVAEIIEAAIDAAAAGDLDGLRKATEALVLTSPARVIKPDGSPTASAGPELFERANVLIHALQSMQPASGEGAAQDGNGR